MSATKLAVKIEPGRYAESSLTAHGTVPLADMPRLCRELAATDGFVTASLEFFRDEDNYILINLKFQADLKLTCQRCLGVCTYSVTDERLLSPVGEDMERLLPTQYEPCRLENGFVYPRHVLEDELLLSLPVIAKHEDEDCAKTTDKAYYATNDLTELTTQKHNPFDVLAQLKK